jgi:hypothetical protein
MCIEFDLVLIGLKRDYLIYLKMLAIEEEDASFNGGAEKKQRSVC